MLYARMDLINGKLVTLEEKVIDQSTLTTDCWLVQINGLDSCVECDAFNTQDCGGGLALWAKINDAHALPPVCHWALAEVEHLTNIGHYEPGYKPTALKIGKGQTGTEWDRTCGFALKAAWRWYKQRIMDKLQTRMIAQGGQEVSKDLVDALSRKVGHAAMVAGYRSNTFGGVVQKGGQLYILSLNTRTFRLSYEWGDWRHEGAKTRRLPWLTPTSAGALQIAMEDYESHNSGSRHLRLYYGATNAPTEKARCWVVEQGYTLVV